MTPSSSKLLRVAVIAMALFYAALFIGMVIVRLLYPYEVEFMEGLVADHCLRLINGLPIYDRPQLDFIATIYPPLYYYLSAGIMEIAGIGLFAPRLVSALSTVGTCFLVYAILRRQTDTKLIALLGPAIYIAAYGACGFFYDTARVDALFIFIVMAAIALLHERARTESTLSFGFLLSLSLIFALAFFAKQQAILFIMASAVWMLLRSWRSSLIMLVCVGAMIGLGVVLLDTVNNGWFSYYVFTIPSAQGSQFNYYSFFNSIPELLLRFWAIPIFVIVFWLTRSSGSLVNYLRSDRGLLAIMLLTSIGALMFSYGNVGGYRNVVMPVVALVAVVFPLALCDLLRHEVISQSVAVSAIMLQFIALWVSPLWEGRFFASQANREAGDRFIAMISEVPGRVHIPNHGFLNHLAGKPMQYHIIGYRGVLIANDEHARAIERINDSALASHAYGAVIIDEDQISIPDSLTGYSLREQMFEAPAVFSSKLLDIGTRPQYIYLPK